MSTWKTVGIVDNQNMMVPHVLQQRLDHDMNPMDDHRLVSIKGLDGIE